MHQRQAVPREALEDEPLTSEEPGQDLALKRHSDLHSPGGTKKGVLLANQLAPQLVQVHRDDLARVGRGEGNLLALLPPSGESSEEKRLARQHPLAGIEQLTEQALLLARITENRLHLNPGRHAHHGARVRHHHLPRIERHFDILHVVAEDLVIDLVRPAWRGRPRRRRRAGKLVPQGRYVVSLGPFRHARTPYQGLLPLTPP